MALKDGVEFKNPYFLGKTKKNLRLRGEMFNAWATVADKWKAVLKQHVDDDPLWQSPRTWATNTANGGYVSQSGERYIGTYQTTLNSAFDSLFDYASVIQYAPSNNTFNSLGTEGIGTGTAMSPTERFSDYAGGNITYNLTTQTLRDFIAANATGLHYGAVPTTIDYDSDLKVPRWHITGYDIDSIIDQYGDYLVPIALDVVDKTRGEVLISYTMGSSNSTRAYTVDSLSAYRAYDWCGSTRNQKLMTVVGFKKSRDFSANNPAAPYDMVGYCSEGLCVFLEQISNWRRGAARMAPIFNNSTYYNTEVSVGAGVGIWLADTSDHLLEMGLRCGPYINTTASLIAWNNEDRIIEYFVTNVGFGVTFNNLDKALDPTPDPGNKDDDGIPSNPVDDGDGDGDNISDSIRYPNPTVVPTAGRRFYALTGAQVGQLADFIFSETFLNNVARLWTEPGDYIIDLSYYPTDLIATGLTWGSSATKVTVGNVESNITAPELLGGKPYLYMGEYTIGRYYNSYLDFAPYTRLEIYLPYIGLRPLDINQVMGHTIKVGYYLDYVSQKCLALIGLDGVGDDLGQPIAQYTGDVAVHVPLSGQSAQQLLIGSVKQATGLIGSVGGIVGSAMTGNVGGIIGSAAGVANSLVPEQVSRREYGSMTAVTGIYSPQEVFLVIDRPISAEPANFKAKLGYAASYGANVSEFSGYLQVTQCDLQPTGTMSKDECNEIIQLLQGGIYI